ncbi:hypothetical protein [Flammeovirga sp. SJP92]|uniref:hypothetical protein n=1 Tax=Flammeovirga sp. SJP92 TaxID=1775430 RepID=UPI000786D7C4|nr:hypothetical protein [Flammeovirga sp. SJP92]
MSNLDLTLSKFKDNLNSYLSLDNDLKFFDEETNLENISYLNGEIKEFYEKVQIDEPIYMGYIIGHNILPISKLDISQEGWKFIFLMVRESRILKIGILIG